ncbi:hypothetical protein C8R48DRAFT_673963 [Suillus tomentosus]|nr:hypothetical protein C8R48DRAFT_673963 [Suillus tomentosus]
MPFLRIELVDHTNESDEKLTSEEDDGDNKSAWNDKASLLLLPTKKHRDGEVDPIARMEERLQLAEMNSARLEELYQKYRLRWLEENYRVRVMKEHTPSGISTFSPRQIAWDAPSPPQIGELQGRIHVQLREAKAFRKAMIAYGR